MSAFISAVSFGGGVQSTALLVLAAQGDLPASTFLFANVGDDSENPLTLDYVRDVAMPYAETHGLDLIELHRPWRDGRSQTLLQTLTKEGSRSIDIPVRMANGAPGNRNCTETFKINVIARWLKEHGATPENKGTLMLGISVDEFQRARSSSGFAYYDTVYPLIERRIDRAACHAIIERAGLPVPPKSSCWFCPYSTVARWKAMKKDQPELFVKAVDLERQLNERRASLGKDNIFLHSKLKPLDQVIGNAEQRSIFDDPESSEDACESGYCMI